MTTTSLTRLTDRAKRYATKTLKEDQLVKNEPVTWDVTVSVFPDPTLPDALIPSLVFYLEIPGPLPDNSMYICTILAPYGLNQARVDKAINDALKSMRESRQNHIDNPDSE